VTIIPAGFKKQGKNNNVRLSLIIKFSQLDNFKQFEPEGWEFLSVRYFELRTIFIKIYMYKILMEGFAFWAHNNDQILAETPFSVFSFI